MIIDLPPECHTWLAVDGAKVGKAKKVHLQELIIQLWIDSGKPKVGKEMEQTLQNTVSKDNLFD